MSLLLTNFLSSCLCHTPVNLCSNPEDKLQIYRDNFEKAYLDSTERFYRTQALSYLQQNGVQNYMKYVWHNSMDKHECSSSPLYIFTVIVIVVLCFDALYVCVCAGWNKAEGGGEEST